MSGEQTLRRSISLPLLTLYGLGTTIGAGIFVLIGKIVGISGAYAPISFLLASLLAGLSAFSFAEMSSRYPESAGEAAYVREGLGSQSLAFLVGLGVVAAALVSSSAIIIGFSGYLGEFVPWPPLISRLAVVFLLGLFVCWGVKISVSLAAVVTVIEIAALLAVIVAGGGQTFTDMGDMVAVSPSLDGGIWIGILSGSVLAFYAFIGFEDIVNVAEETHDPSRTVPYAIVLTLVFTALLYITVSLVAISSVPVDRLARSDAPLALIFEHASGISGKPISAVAAVSVLNGALIQIIMASRVLYGLSRRKMLPGWLGYVHPPTRTPVASILICVGAIAFLTSVYRIESLAALTSLITLVIAALVNAALLRIKMLGTPATGGTFTVPGWVPLLGLLSAVALVAFDLWRRVA